MGYTRAGVGFQKRDTSLKAACSSVSKKMTLKTLALNLIADAKRPLSTEQISDALEKPYVSVQPRLSELANDGLIKDSGHRGKTKWGKLCILWEKS